MGKNEVFSQIEIDIASKPLKTAKLPQNATVFLSKSRSTYVKPFANPPSFWTKTDLRKCPRSCILQTQSQPKATRSEPKNSPLLPRTTKDRPPNFGPAAIAEA